MLAQAHYPSAANAGKRISSPGVLVVSANQDLRYDLKRLLHSSRWAVSECASGAECIESLDNEVPEVIVLDPVLPDLRADELRSLIATQCPATDIITVNPQTGLPLPVATDRAQRADGLGALSKLCLEAFQRNHDDCQQFSNRGCLPDMIGDSPEMQVVYRMTRLVAERDTTVLITGESGTGKELVASALHTLSARRRKPFVVINCAAIPEALLEAELFGYVKGSFTGAVQSNGGRISAANGGTLFLDEIGELPIHLQSKLLRFIEKGEIQRLGSTEISCVKVRVVAATNVAMRSLVQEGRFRSDLYYRLGVFPIELPALRNRPADIAQLSHYFVKKLGCGTLSLSKDSVTLLEQHQWPGNVRELRNVIERATIMAGRAAVITPEHITF